MRAREKEMKPPQRYDIGGLRILAILALFSGIFFSAPSHALQIGARVQANATVNVRSSAAGTVIGTQASGNQGSISGGPQVASLNNTSYTWWYVNWDAGVDGWVADIGLTSVATQPSYTPGTPTLSSPSNGATVSGTSVMLSWNPVSGAGAYSVGLRDQTTGALANIPLLTGTSYTASVIQGHSYTWDVASCTSASSGDNTSNCPNRTSNWSFTVQAAIVVPGTPTLSSPSNRATVSGTPVTLSWNPVSGAGAYSVGLRDQTTGALANMPLLTGTSYTASVIQGHSYTWDVASCVSPSSGDNTTNCPNRTSNWSFTVQAATTPPVLLVTPANMAVGAASGTTSFNVSNSGSGSLSYSANVTNGSSWLSIVSGASGGNSGTINVSYTANTGAQRSGTIRVTANGASGSPATLTVTQSGASVSSLFLAGQRITAAPGGVNVWNGALTSILFQQQGGVHGTLVGNPMNGTAGGATGNWWQINWDSAPPNLSGQEMWSAETLLSLASSAADAPKPDFSSRYYAPVNGNNSLSANIFVQSGEAPTSTPMATDFINSALGNCTWYAYGRLLELGANAGELSALHGHAGDWANEAHQAHILFDNTPTVGSVAQLNSKSGYLAGHVAIVEYVSPNKAMITVSESSYEPDISNPWNFLWRRRTVSPTWFDNFIHVSGVGGGTSIDTTPPTMNAFSVTPYSTTRGSPLTISLTTSDTGGSGLNRAELKRSNGDGTANDPNWMTINTTPLSGNGPVTATFSDQPTSSGAWWYGVWVYDNSGNRIDERTAGLGPLSVAVGSASSPADCFFNWAESTYPTLFAPAGAPSKTLAPYYYRYYSQTRTYLATSSANNHLQYLGPPTSNNAILDLGEISTWLNKANCQ